MCTYVTACGDQQIATDLRCVDLFLMSVARVLESAVSQCGDKAYGW